MVINYSIKPFIRTDKTVKENNKYPIYYFVRIDNKQVKIPAKKEIEGTYWDKKSEENLNQHLRGYKKVDF